MSAPSKLTLSKWGWEEKAGFCEALRDLRGVLDNLELFK